MGPACTGRGGALGSRRGGGDLARPDVGVSGRPLSFLPCSFTCHEHHEHGAAALGRRDGGGNGALEPQHRGDRAQALAGSWPPKVPDKLKPASSSSSSPTGPPRPPQPLQLLPNPRLRLSPAPTRQARRQPPPPLRDARMRACAQTRAAPARPESRDAARRRRRSHPFPPPPPASQCVLLVIRRRTCAPPRRRESRKWREGSPA